MSEVELRAVEDRAVREAIALQEAAGLEVITDGELRRQSWVVTIPLREEGAAHAPLAGYTFLPADPGWWSLWKEPDGQRARIWTATTRPFITRPLQVVRDVISEEYAFLKANAHRRTKFTIPAPSWHRIFWHLAPHLVASGVFTRGLSHTRRLPPRDRRLSACGGGRQAYRAGR